jgi:hypothetical protein
MIVDRSDDLIQIGFHRSTSFHFLVSVATAPKAPRSGVSLAFTMQDGVRTLPHHSDVSECALNLCQMNSGVITATEAELPALISLPRLSTWFLGRRGDKRCIACSTGAEIRFEVDAVLYCRAYQRKRHIAYT